jgi:hypothetical protein
MIEAKADRLNVNTARAIAKRDEKSEKGPKRVYVTTPSIRNGK